MSSVIIAGATGYLGRHLVTAYKSHGYHVRALVRSAARAADLGADELIEAEATRPASFAGRFAGADLIVSALGITRQRDGLSYRDVDYQANRNLLDEALVANIARFAYVHVLGADKMQGVPLVDAKQAFVAGLQKAPIASTVIAPSGYFSDMGDFFAMAKSGRVWQFGDGHLRLNPIHGADLAEATVAATEAGRDWLDIGGPDILSQRQIGELAFAALNRPAKITELPDWLRKLVLAVVPAVTPQSISGPLKFFLTGLAMEMVGEQHGTHHLADHFARLAREEQAG
ncbi:SDR family oxidoreductase [Devosia sp.]|uniref:SDR family oxidoreductase n=1 Tax=Devosia sp. TaxID=1871048 RepID=UPI003A907DAF